jgi:signal transduction histidine kinase
MSRILPILQPITNVSRRLIALVLVASLTAFALVYLLQLTIEETHRAQRATAKEQFRAALSDEIALFEHKLTARIGCNSTKCTLDWSAQIAEEFPWSSLALRQLDEDTPSATLGQGGTLGDTIKSLTIRERISLYANPVYVFSDQGSGKDTLVVVYVRDPEDRRYIRTSELYVNKLLNHVSSTLTAEGVFINAKVVKNQLGSEQLGRDIMDLSKLGTQVVIAIPTSSAQSKSTVWLAWVVSALAALLLISIWLVVNETRRRRVAEATSREYEERAQSSAKLATLGEIASMLSHELNQPLAAIESFASAANNIAARHNSDPNLEKCIDQIRSQVRRADLIIRSVHGFLKPKSNDLQSFNLCAAIYDLMPLLEIQSRRTGAKLNLLMPEQLWITANKTMVEQVILNLARNGLEAMRDQQDDAKVLTIALAKKLGTQATTDEILSNSVVGMPHVQISVSDRGAGIPPEIREKIFMPFVSTKDSGAGIGLSLCRSVAERHKGHISFRDNPAGGTTFTLLLPEAPPNAVLEA